MTELAVSSLAEPAQAWFCHHLPELHSRSQACFARLNADAREEATAEVLASSYQVAFRASQRGVLHRLTPYYLVNYAQKQYRQGRRFAGYTSTDCLSEATKAKGRVKVLSLEEIEPECGQSADPSLPLHKMLSDRRDGDPLEQVRKNLDYPAIFRCEHVSKKAKRLFRLLAEMRGRGSHQRIAQILSISPGRVTQLKAQLARALAKHEYDPRMLPRPRVKLKKQRRCIP